MADTTNQSPHNTQLQSLRGIAALVVMIHHSLRVYGSGNWAWVTSEWILNAQAAVIIFFVLSGYVLSRSLARRGLDRRGVTIFYIRRAFRIYPALWIGIAFGAVYALVIRPLSASHLSDWVMGHYIRAQMTPATVAGSLIGTNNYLLPPAWTITAELSASLILPALVWAFLKEGKLAILFTIMLAISGLIAGPALRMVPYYSVDFALGAMAGCMPWIRSFRPHKGLMLLALAVLLFGQLLLLPGHPWIVSIIEGLCSLLLVVGLTTTDYPCLRHPWLVMIGDRSYSIYLLHLPIAFSIAQLVDHAGLVGHNSDSWALIVSLLTAIATILISGFIYRYIELTGIRAGVAISQQRKAKAIVKPAHPNGQI